MAKFVDSTSAKHPARRKERQTVTVTVVTHVNDHNDWQDIVTSWPDSYEWRVISVAGHLVTSVVTYTAAGANLTDVKRRLMLQHIVTHSDTEKL